MRLANKLARFLPQRAATRAAPPTSDGEPGRERDRMRSALERLPAARIRPNTRLDEVLGALEALGSGAPPSLAEALPGVATPTSRGATWVHTTRYAASDTIGEVSFQCALDAGFAHLERMTADPRLEGFDPRRALFLDIEATGLEHGSGTLAFLIGLGFFEDDTLTLEQVLLRDHDEEAALLELVWEAVESFPFLVSFNGKSFDLSVLQNRMVMHRMCSRRECQLKLRPHLDLLHVSRGLYKGMWPDVRLQTLEAHVLGLVREDDVSGALAPLCWFAWLKEADPRPLVGIVKHNRLDVLSMVALAGRLAHDAEPRPDAGRPSRMALNLAQLYVRKRANAEALEVLDDTPFLASRQQRLAMLELAVTASRRLGDGQRYLQALEALLALDPDRAKEARALARARRRLARDQSVIPSHLVSSPAACYTDQGPSTGETR